MSESFTRDVYGRLPEAEMDASAAGTLFGKEWGDREIPKISADLIATPEGLNEVVETATVAFEAEVQRSLYNRPSKVVAIWREYALGHVMQRLKQISYLTRMQG